MSKELELRDKVQRYVGAKKALCLGTQQDGSKLASAPLYFYAEGFLSFFFVSDPKSEHSLNVESSPAVSGAIFDEGETVLSIQGLQFKGRCDLVKEEGRSACTKAYLERFPELREHQVMLDRLGKLAFYKIEVTWLRWMEMGDKGPLRSECTL